VENPRRIPLLDLVAQHRTIRNEVLQDVIRVVDSQKFILGEDVQAFEAYIAAYCSTQFAVGCASGSDALFLALTAGGIGPGDRVLTTPYSFFATAGEICHAGATPVFADVDPSTFNIDPAKARAAVQRDGRIKAIIPVHLFGACADMDPVLALAEEHDLLVVEDAAQSLGAEYKARRAGSLGHMGCFSFYPSKNLGGYGDGGMVTTTDAALADKLSALRVHGARRKYHHDWVGVNSRLDALQAAVLRVKLRHLDGWTAKRQEHAELYHRLFTERRTPVILPVRKPYQTRHVYNQFVIRAERRDELQRFLAGQGIGTDIYYPVPMHQQACFGYLGYKRGDFPVSEELAGTSLALPVYPELSSSDIEFICDTVHAFFASA
jgi:dTDP-4-amino-4,6-dideoxygalactose transaminase